MKKIVLAALLLIASVWADGHKMAVVDNVDCVESLENEIIGIIYKGKVKNAPIDDLTGKINKTFDKNCDTPEKAEKVVVIKKTADIKDCVENLEDEIIKMIKTSPKDSNQEVSVKILIENVSQNFEDCKDPEKK